MKPEGGFDPPPPSVAVVTRTIVIMCIAVQAAASFGGAGLADRLAAHAALVPARVTGMLPTQPGDVPAALTLLTSLFLHAGWIHLALNLTFLGWVGRHVELAVGRWRFVLLYLLCGIAGGLLQVAVDQNSAAPVVGASGAIAGVFAAYAVLFARSRAAARRIFGISFSSEIASALWYAATWIGLQLLTAVAFNTGQGGIAIWSHIGGFLLGLILIQPIARTLR